MDIWQWTLSMDLLHLLIRTPWTEPTWTFRTEEDDMWHRTLLLMDLYYTYLYMDVCIPRTWTSLWSYPFRSQKEDRTLRNLKLQERVPYDNEGVKGKRVRTSPQQEIRMYVIGKEENHKKRKTIETLSWRIVDLRRFDWRKRKQGGKRKIANPLTQTNE